MHTKLTALKIAAAVFALASAFPSMPANAAEANTSSDRYRVKATVQQTQIRSSVDGRFALQASAKFLQTHTSDNGRFVLKATNTPNGGCAAFPDPIFENGFE